MTNLTRKVKFDLFKASGKWYAGGIAYVDPRNNYFDDELLVKHIADTQHEVYADSIVNRSFRLVVDEIDDGPFIKRMIDFRDRRY